METDIVLVRHGQTHWNHEGRIQGHRDTELDETGHQQAHNIARRLADEAFDAIYSSDLKRAHYSAVPASTILGIKIIQRENLREWNLGEFQGLSHEEAKQRFQDAYGLFRLNDPDTIIPGGETFHQFYDRCLRAITEIAEAHPGQSILVFTHGGVINCLLRKVHGVPLTSKLRYHVGNTSVTRICAEHAKDGLKWRMEATDCDPVKI